MSEHSVFVGKEDLFFIKAVVKYFEKIAWQYPIEFIFLLYKFPILLADWVLKNISLLFHFFSFNLLNFICLFFRFHETVALLDLKFFVYWIVL